MTDEERLAFPAMRTAGVQSCWMCGTRLPASSMVADGGSACADVRWYCQDTRGCTERWTARRALAAQGGDGSGLLDPRERQFGGPPTGPSPVWRPAARAARGFGPP
ncbi:MAG TPA: hypothetical protein VMH35_17650 [Streptosporangiaceae bacterium]|nr:hypothetical protein [Streptosporangiaceae bacterium]